LSRIADASDASSEIWRIRLLEALADECARLSVQIARLDNAVKAGDGGIATLQGLAGQSQALQGLCGVLDMLYGPRRAVAARIARLPLRGLRRRLRGALDGDRLPAADRGAAVIWRER
jgi:hypothetical protein